MSEEITGGGAPRITTVAQRETGGCEIEISSPFCLVIFGASGDLAKRKIVPALYRLYRDRLFPERFCVVGAARTGMSEKSFRNLMEESVRDVISGDFDTGVWSEFAKKLSYTQVEYDRRDSFLSLKKRIASLEKKHDTGGNRICYLAVPPTVYEQAVSNLGASGLSRGEKGLTHVVIEKPVGHDLESSRRLNAILRESFAERQVYRMDHYLAKETVQNILMFRFANSIFEPLWNRRYIDHVQITVSETLGVEHRAGYYESAGVIRDMFQNHIFQLLALTAMEPPSVFEAERVREEKVKVLRSLRPFPGERIEDTVVLGQYGKGRINGKPVTWYRGEPGVAANSSTPTYAAMKVLIDNWRWHGVPFYLRSGKRLAKKKAEIAVHYRPVPHLMFSHTLEERIEPNCLVLRLQPDEGISLTFQAKTPGSRVCLGPVVMDFSYKKIFTLGDYERVLLDCMQGDQMLFVRDDEVDQTWAILTPVLEVVESEGVAKDFPNYESGSEGPDSANSLLERDGRSWRPL